MSKPLIEALKELLRTFILGEIPVLITVLGVIKSGINIEIGGFKIQWLLVISILISGTIGVFQTAVMSSIDKWIYKNDIKTPLNME